jgi:phage terminase small subunit
MAELSNPKYEAFCQEYLIDLNGAQAAIRAGYSENGANVKGAQLLAIVSIQERIKELKQARAERTQITADRVLQEIAYIAFARVDDFVNVVEVQSDDEDGKTSKFKLVEVNATQTMTEDKVRAISSIKQGKDGIELKLHDKVKALELLGKHRGIFEADNKQKTDITVKRIGFESDI